MKANMWTTLVIIIVLFQTTLPIKVQSQSLYLRPCVQAGLILIAPEAEYEYTTRKVNRLNYGIGVLGLIGFGPNSTVKIGVELGWGKLYSATQNSDYWGEDIDEKESSVRILPLVEFSPNNKRFIFQTGSGIHYVFFNRDVNLSSSLGWNEGGPHLAFGFMVAGGIIVYKSEKISIPLIIRIDGRYRWDMLAYASISTGVTFGNQK